MKRFFSDQVANEHMNRMSNQSAGATEIFRTAPPTSALGKINALALAAMDRDGTLSHSAAINRVLLSPGGAALYQKYLDERE